MAFKLTIVEFFNIFMHFIRHFSLKYGLFNPLLQTYGSKIKLLDFCGPRLMNTEKFILNSVSFYTLLVLND